MPPLAYALARDSTKPVSYHKILALLTKRMCDLGTRRICMHDVCGWDRDHGSSTDVVANNFVADSIIRVYDWLDIEGKIRACPMMLSRAQGPIAVDTDRPLPANIRVRLYGQMALRAH